MTPVRLTRRQMLRLGAGSAVGALLAACGGDGRSMLAPIPDTPAGKRAGNLRVGVPSPSRDPVVFANLVYSRLVVLDPRRNAVYGDLAEAVEVASDGLEVRFRLRDGLRFHPDAAGLAAALTAEDVKRDFAARAQAGEYLFAQGIERVEAPDLQTVVLRMRAPFSLLFDYLADASIAGIRSTARYTRVDAPLGSGPFVPATREAIGIAMVANPLYHRKRVPLLEQVQVFDGGPPRDVATAVADGELGVGLHAPDAKPADAGHGHVVTARRISRRMRGLGFSLMPQKGTAQTRSIPAFQDERVRRAASLALDRQVLIALDGGVLTGPVGPAHSADALSDEELRKHPLYRHDPAEAKRLLDAAGKSGLAFTLEGANRPAARLLAQAVEGQLREVGFVPQARLLPVADWELAVLAGDFVAGIVEFDELRTPDLGLRMHVSGGLSGKFSPWGYSNPLYDAAARKVFAEVNPTARAQRSREAQRVLLDAVPAMFPLSAAPDYASLAPELRGFEFDAFEFNESWLGTQWRLESTTR